MKETLPVFLTASGVARQLGICAETLRRRCASGKITPDGVVIETQNHPGSIVFSAENLPSIAAQFAAKKPAKKPEITP